METEEDCVPAQSVADSKYGNEKRTKGIRLTRHEQSPLQKHSPSDIRRRKLRMSIQSLDQPQVQQPQRFFKPRDRLEESLDLFVRFRGQWNARVMFGQGGRPSSDMYSECYDPEITRWLDWRTIFVALFHIRELLLASFKGAMNISELAMCLLSVVQLCMRNKWQLGLEDIDTNVDTNKKNQWTALWHAIALSMRDQLMSHSKNRLNVDVIELVHRSRFHQYGNISRTDYDGAMVLYDTPSLKRDSARERFIVAHIVRDCVLPNGVNANLISDTPRYLSQSLFEKRLRCNVEIRQRTANRSSIN